MATGMFDNDAAGICLQQSPGVPSSPASIPLPDSLPPEDPEEIFEGTEKLDEEEERDSSRSHSNNHDTGGLPISNVVPRTSRGSRKSSRKPRLIEEYDPSEPLTSSDEEEHSIQLIEGGLESVCTEFKSSYGEVNPSETNSNSSNNLVRVTKTPPPPPIISSSKLATFPATANVNKLPSPNPLEQIANYSNVNYNNGSGNSNSIRIDLSSQSAQSDEKRRPVIHFSIPTRHRLLPISTLIKRQKGGARRDGKGDGIGGPNPDPSKSSDRLLDGMEDDEDSEEPKISLVAEIFGDDDDDEDDVENKTDGTPQPAKCQEKDSLNQQDVDSAFAVLQIPPDVSTLLASDKTQLIDANSGRWKLVANELSIPPVTNDNSSFSQPSEANTEQETSEGNSELPTTTSSLQGNSVDGESAIPSQEDEPEIIEIVTINVPGHNRLRPLRRRPFLSRYGMENGAEPEVIDIDKDDDEEIETNQEVATVAVEAPVDIIPEPEPSPPTPPTPPRLPTPPTTSPLPRVSTPVIVEPEVRSEPERPRRSYSRSVEKERPHFKRPHSSSSVSNCEEGEIVDQVNPNKKRKKDKKKKMKKRKKSRDSMTPPPKSSEKKSSERGTSPAPSDKEENSSRSAVSWRKPSKRTQNRNYRDGKPKADDTFFRERETEETQRSSSPTHKRSRGSTRKESSPIANKSSNKHRRDETINRPYSKSPPRVVSESRSKTGAGTYAGRRRHRRSRSNSSSSGRSASRRRSRRGRYRRSTSRHRQGDSRSPSYITELIRPCSSSFSKPSDKSRSRSRDRHTRRNRKSSVSKSRSHSPMVSGHRKTRKAESSDRPQKRKQLKEKEKQLIEETIAENKEKRKERERLKEKEKEKKNKKKEKTQEEAKKEQKEKEKEKVKEKEKKKKRKRREKSPTPVKAIVADGDSIVVSLSFSKGKTSTTASNAQSRASTEDHSKDHHNGLQASEASESSNIAHGSLNGNDTERNVTAEDSHHSHNSSDKSADDTGSTTPSNASQATECSSKGKKAEEKETETIKVTSSGGGSCGSRSPFETENSCSAVADSTKVIHSQQIEQYESSFSHSRPSSMSPTDVESSLQGDSLVTSTGDTIDLPPLIDEESFKPNSSSTPSKQTDSSKIFASLSHKATANMSPRGSQTTTSCTTSESGNGNTPSATTSHALSSAGGSSQNFASTSTPHTRPLIGNIPGLYPSSAINSSGGAVPVPPPIVIPTPPPPQGIRFSGGNSNAPMLNPNVLASVASALLAVRQNQPTLAGKMAHASGGSGSNSDNSNMQHRHMNVLGPKSQNFTIQSNMRNSSGGNYTEDQGGDSPMSPNSSEGDDLFEPPTDRPQSEKGANGGSSKGGKNVQQLFGNSTMLPTNNPIDNFNSAGHTNKERNLFDSLFDPGTEIKKSTAPKPEKVNKTKQKLRKGGVPKKETIKVSTSGGLTKGELRLADEVPTSAVELIVKQKYLKKLNRQERVVEEVKLSLKPHYSKRHINKDEYKEILRRAVPKICHNKTGEINPGKIKELVEAYVKKFRHARKRGLDMSSIK